MNVIIKNVDWRGLEIFTKSAVQVEGNMDNYPTFILKGVDSIVKMYSGEICIEVEGCLVLKFVNSEAFSIMLVA